MDTWIDVMQDLDSNIAAAMEIAGARHDPHTSSTNHFFDLESSFQNATAADRHLRTFPVAAMLPYHASGSDPEDDISRRLLDKSGGAPCSADVMQRRSALGHAIRRVQGASDEL